MNTLDDGIWDTFRPGLTDDGKHVCYFCTDHGYPPMPDGYTLCARCGTFMHTGITDPKNEAMNICHECRIELA